MDESDISNPYVSLIDRQSIYACRFHAGCVKKRLQDFPKHTCYELYYYACMHATHFPMSRFVHFVFMSAEVYTSASASLLPLMFMH